MRPNRKEEGSPMESYVGLDVHSKRSVFVIEAEDGRVVARGDIPTTPAGFRQLRQQHELAAETHVALETGTVAFYAARELARVGLRPVVIDAHEVRVKAHRPRQKSDRRDAFELCEGLRRGHYRAIVHVPPAPIGALRETLSRRRHFVAVRVAEGNAVKRLLRAAGLGPLRKRPGAGPAWGKPPPRPPPGPRRRAPPPPPPKARRGAVAHLSVGAPPPGPPPDSPLPPVLRPPVRAARLQDGRRRGRPSPLPHSLCVAARRRGLRRRQARRRRGRVPPHDGAALPAQTRDGEPRMNEEPAWTTD